MSLRHVARHAGLSFNPTIHMARHTFATTVTLTQGVPLETVCKMLGHKRITTTQIYAKITNDKIGQDMKALSEKLSSVFKAVSYTHLVHPRLIQQIDDRTGAHVGAADTLALEDMARLDTRMRHDPLVVGAC